MSATEKGKWLCIGLLAVACAVSLTACGDDDNDDDAAAAGTTVVVVTNATTVVTNVVEEETVLVAPQLVTPADGTIYSVLLVVDTGYKVNFEWTAVPGAASYVIELNGVQTPVAGTQITLEKGYGEYKWRVWAKDADGASGPAIGKFSFTVKSKLIQI